jgi:hypothetical protein
MTPKYTYEKHCEEMKARGHDPMSEQHFKEMMELETLTTTVRPKPNSRPKPTNFKEYEWLDT